MYLLRSAGQIATDSQRSIRFWIQRQKWLNAIALSNKASSITQVVAQEPHEQWLQFMQGRWQVQMPDGTQGICTWRSAENTPALNFESTTSPEFSIVGVIGWRADERVFIENLL